MPSESTPQRKRRTGAASPEKAAEATAELFARADADPADYVAEQYVLSALMHGKYRVLDETEGLLAENGSDFYGLGHAA